jgi:hypothetical protein
MTVEDDARHRDPVRQARPADGGKRQLLSRQECLDLLGSVRIGRLVYTRQALPAVEPVSFAVCGNDIVILADPNGQLAAAVRGDVVAFEADALDVTAQSGWSVTVIGHSRAAREPEDVSRLRGLSLSSWTPGGNDTFICIDIAIVRGRRLYPSRGASLPASSIARPAAGHIC